MQDGVYEVLAVRYGTRDTTRAECYLHYETYHEADAPLAMDYFFWVLRGRSESIVVDTGFGAGSGRRRGRASLIAPEAALQGLGVAAETVPLLLLTHAHYDHIGNLGAFARAEMVLSQREYAFWTGPYGAHPVIAATAEPEEIAQLTQLRADGRLTLVGREHAPRPGVRMIEVGGHTPGQTIVVVQTETGPVVLASDAVHYYEELMRRRPFAHVVDVEAMLAAYDQVLELTGGSDERVLAGHDPEVMSRFAPVDGELAPYVRRIA